jgi:hypothetical protein
VYVVDYQCPLHPQKRTLKLSRAMSALCQKRTHAPQQTPVLFDDLVGADEQRLWEREAERLSCAQIHNKVDLH